jgi:hypothetical protein
VDGAVLVERDPGVKLPSGAEEVERRLAVVALVGLVNVGEGLDEEARALGVPLKLDLVTLEE